MKKILIIVLLLLCSGCQKVESNNENALVYKNGKCIAFYPDNDSIKEFVKNRCEDKQEKILDYKVDTLGDFYIVSYDEQEFLTEKDFSDVKLTIEDRLDIVSNALRYQMKKDDIDLAYTSKFMIDTDVENLDVSNVIIRKDNNDLLMYFPKFGYQLVLDLAYGQQVVKRDFNVQSKEYEMKYYLNPNRPMIALTYDDGPYRVVDSEIFDTMKKYDARCTFYIVGSRLGEYELETVKMGLDLNLEFGSHSMNHEKLPELSYGDAYYTIVSVSDYLSDKLGYTMSSYRPPYGLRRNDLESGLDMVSVLWNVDSMDWSNRNSEYTYNNVVNKSNENDVVLMHSLYSSTADATKRIVPDLIDKGYQLVTVRELMDHLGVTGRSFGGR